MSGLRVFISSTCYDLGQVRNQIRSLILRLGHEPIMSEHSDVLFDPRMHTHTSCIHEVPRADVMILLVGPRFGGTAVPQALSYVNFEATITNSTASKKLDEFKDKISVTQLEVIKAIEAGISIFAFIDSKVYSDQYVYENNKSTGISTQIKFPSIEKKMRRQLTSSNLSTF